MPTVAMPRAMSYYYLYPFFAAFFEHIGVDLIVSPPTTKQTLNKMEVCPTDEPCLAVKLLFAHAQELLDAGHKQLLVPCLVSMEPKNFCCPKFIGVPYMVKHALSKKIKIHIPEINLFANRDDWKESFVRIGSSFNVGRQRVLRALREAWRAQDLYELACVDQRLTGPEAFAYLRGQKPCRREHPQDTPGVGVIGHPYILYDTFTIDILKSFRDYGKVITAEMVPAAEARRQVAGLLEGERLWSFEARILGAALYLLRNNLVQKLVLVGSFECGPESVIEGYVEDEAARRGVPFLLLTVDEHTGEAGLQTRIEAFMDVQPLESLKTAGRPDENRPLEVSAATVPGVRAEEFIIGMPTMGHLDVAIRSALVECGIKSLKTPHASKEILELGKELAPEFVCLPFTITLGQMRWLLQNGATNILMVGGKGKCRLGWYAQIQDQLLRKIGHDFNMLIIDSPFPLGERWSNFRSVIKRTTKDASWLKILRALYFGYHKMAAIDEAERICHRIRAFESKRGAVDRLFRRFIRDIENASLTETVWGLARDFREAAAAIPLEDTNPVRVRIVGEIWVVLEAYVNHHLEEMLGRYEDPRVWVDREISATSWFHQHLFPTRKATERKHVIKEAANRYLGTDPGGHGHKSVGLTALAGSEGIDGIIHLMPFTCMPEIVAQNIMVKMSQELDIPVLTFIITDQTGEAGFETRVEAFLDILKDRAPQDPALNSKSHLTPKLNVSPRR